MRYKVVETVTRGTEIPVSLGWKIIQIETSKIFCYTYDKDIAEIIVNALQHEPEIKKEPVLDVPIDNFLRITP